MKKLIFAGILIFSIMACGCSSKTQDISDTETTSETISETEITQVSETETEQVTTTTASLPTQKETEATTMPVPEIEFIYQPPKEVLDTHFYSDDILLETNFNALGFSSTDRIGWFRNSDYTYLTPELFDDVNYMQGLYDDFAKYVPKSVVDDMCIQTQNLFIQNDQTTTAAKLLSLDYMQCDMNSDGISDYLVIGYIAAGSAIYYDYFCKIYLMDESEKIIKSINWNCNYYWYSGTYLIHILATKTNGLNDIMVLCNSNYPIITYDGKDSYTEHEISDEQHVFGREEAISDNILHLNLNIFNLDFIVDGEEIAGDYYIALNFANKPFLKNRIAYTSYPDGTPLKYNYPDNNPTRDGMDFYIEINDGYRIDDIDLDLLEIKVIKAD